MVEHRGSIACTPCAGRRTLTGAPSGAMLARAYQNMEIAPEQMYPPGLIIMLTALAFNTLGESLRTALDPTMKKL